MVFLVGAGPGDPGLLTIKGRECLAIADAVLYDYLVNPVLLDHSPPSSRRIYVGKQPGRPAMSQESINTALVELAQQGNIVIRLKGGDPFIYGRGGEEAEALRAAGVPFQVVPGVSSAFAVPAYAGIPLTHRSIASTVRIFTGHGREDDGEARSSLPPVWRANEETLVILMGVGRLPELLRHLYTAGWVPTTPIALVRWGSYRHQEVVAATLGTVEEELAQRVEPFGSPAVIVIGDVVRLRGQLNWFDELSLHDQRVLVPRTRDRPSQLASYLRVVGARPVELPFKGLASGHLDGPCKDDVTAMLREPFSAVAFPSSGSVRRFAALTERAGFATPSEAIRDGLVACIGSQTAAAARDCGLAVDVVPEQTTLLGLVLALQRAMTRRRAGQVP